MADNITATQGSGTTMATDEIGGVHFPRVKPAIGADGTAVDVSAGAGAVGTGTQRMTLASDDPAVVALQIMDDWDESDRAKVNPIAGQAGVQGGSGAVSALTQRVVLATDVGLPAGSSFLGSIGGNKVEVSATYTRPSDTTAYAAKDGISNATSGAANLTFTSIARISGGSGRITKARIHTSQSTNTALLRLHLYHTAPTAINDNAAYTVLDANKANFIGTIDFPALQTEGSGSDTAYGINIMPNLDFYTSGSANLIGQLETLTAFTPASAQTFHIYLVADQY